MSVLVGIVLVVEQETPPAMHGRGPAYEPRKQEPEHSCDVEEENDERDDSPLPHKGGEG